MRTRFLVVVLAAAAVVLSAGRAEAHDLQLVVKVPRDSPEVLILEAGFDDGTPAEGAKVAVTDAAGKAVAEGKTDEKGVCKLTRPGPGKYTATVEAWGHRDRVEFEIVESGEGEYRGWRPNQAVGLAAGVGGLLAFSAGFWWLRRKKMIPPEPGA
jgi:hypothetical protein